MKLTDEEVQRLVAAYRLSPREGQVVASLLDGAATNEELARAVGTTTMGAGAAMQSVFAKTRRHSRHALTALLVARLIHDRLEEALRAPVPQDYATMVRDTRDRLRRALADE